MPKPLKASETPEKKRSLTVPLIFIGTLGAMYYFFSSSDEEIQVRQDSYLSLQDCQADWGSDPENCRVEQSPSTSSSSHGFYSTSDNSARSTYYSGPRYYWQRTSSGGYPMEIRPDGSTRQITSARITNGQASSHAFSSKSSSGFISRGGFGSSAGHFSSGG